MAPPPTKTAAPTKAAAAGGGAKKLVRGSADLQVRPKKLYKAKEEKPALSKKAQAQLNAQRAGEQVSREKLAAFSKAAGLAAAGKDVALDKLSRKELQALAIKAGVKANAKSADIIKSLQMMQAAASAGAAIMSNPTAALTTDVAARASAGMSAEDKELHELKALGILGKTPGGTQWRKKATTHAYNLRSTVSAVAEEDPAEVEGEEGDVAATGEGEISFRV